MGGLHSTYRGDERNTLVGKFKGRTSLEKSMTMCEDNIKIYLYELIVRVWDG
jgi:hypothetical protein